MIINKPNPEIFEKQSIEYLFQFISLVFEKEEDWDNYDDEISREELWSYHPGILKNALSLLFLALENQIKSKICKITPLLLITEDPQKWKSTHKDKDYHDFHIRPFDDLLVMFLELGLGSMNTKSVHDLDNLRKTRNSIMHGVLNDKLSPKILFSYFILIIDNIWGPGVWWIQLRKYMTAEPLFGLFDAKIEQANLSHYIEFLVNLIGPKETGRILNIDFNQRRYLCPFCHCYLNISADNYFYKHAVLKPNNPESKTLFCVVCDKEYDVERKKCWDNECQGNVIYFLKETPYSDSEICLACGGWAPEDNS